MLAPCLPDLSLVLSLAYSLKNQWRGGRGAGGGQSPPSDNFLGSLKSQRGAKICNSNVKYYTKYVKSSLSTNSKILKHLMAMVQTAFY